MNKRGRPVLDIPDDYPLAKTLPVQVIESEEEDMDEDSSLSEEQLEELADEIFGKVPDLDTYFAFWDLSCEERVRLARAYASTVSAELALKKLSGELGKKK